MKMPKDYSEAVKIARSAKTCMWLMFACGIVIGFILAFFVLALSLTTV